MVEKKASNKSKSENVVDSLWGAWLNQGEFFKTVEYQSLKNIESQKEWIKGTNEQYCQLEDNTKKLASEWKTGAESFLGNNKSILPLGDYQEWLNKLEEVGHKSYSIAFLPGKTTLEVLSKSTDQLEDTVVKVIDQNRKTREEATKAFDGVVEQWKQTQKVMLQFFQLNPGVSK
ncbi:hypothetical protein [Oceanobacillus saliphilus]|uniref:hypothetical protein n=1 Tax=Oceanobacillus saliphilus TaxID=2925834 RepID=UPI00201E0C52|nr:hypothetical protein [Oceanobacillus saliphilus]